MDTVTPERRSWNMSRIRSVNTAPERLVRSLLHRMGYRFRLHQRNMPGSPDIVLPRHKTVVLVHGCFWHRHPECRRAYTPKSNRDYWRGKFAKNVSRDEEQHRELEALGWTVITVWECETGEKDVLRDRLNRHLTQTRI